MDASDDEALELALSRLISGASRVDVTMELQARGLAPKTAFEIVTRASRIVAESRTERRSQHGNLKVVSGTLLLVFGLGWMTWAYFRAPNVILLPIGLLSSGLFLILAGRWRV